MGVYEVIYLILMFNNDFVCEFINIDEIDLEIVDYLIVCEKIDVEFEIVFSNSFGFGGMNCCLVFSKV